MREVLFFERKVNPRFEGEDVRIEQLGTSKFRLWTGSEEDFDFGNRMKRERFEENFINALNQVLDENRQLEVRDREVQISLKEFMKNLERGQSTIKFKITFRIQN